MHHDRVGLLETVRNHVHHCSFECQEIRCLTGKRITSDASRTNVDAKLFDFNDGPNDYDYKRCNSSCDPVVLPPITKIV